MSREIQTSAVLAASQLPLLGLHRWLPALRLVDLIERSEQMGDAVRLSLFHFQVCPTCLREAPVGEGLNPSTQMCARGHRLIVGEREESRELRWDLA